MQRPAHIFHVFSTFSSGGQQSRTCAILNALGPGYRHTITATDGNLSAAERLSTELNVQCVRPPSGKGSLLYPIAFRKNLKELQPDLVITYNWGAFDALAGGLMAGTCALIHTEDGFGADEANRLKLRRVLARRALFRFIDYLAVPSETLKRIALRRYGMAEDRVRFIPNGIDLDRFRPCRNEALRQEWLAGDSNCVFGYIGRLSAEKNLGLMLRAFAKTPDRNLLVLVGSGPEEGPLRRLAAELGIADRVSFPGETKDPSAFYNAFDVFTLTSATEQMPVSLLEAMACGLPAICTSVGDIESILSPSHRLTAVEPGNLEQCAEAMRRLSDDAALRTKLGGENRGRVLRRFGFPLMVERYKELYDAALHRATLDAVN